MSQKNVEIVKRTYDGINDAYKTGDYLQPIEEVCHPDVVLRTSGMFPESGEYHGYAGLREFTRNQAEAFEQMSVQPAEFVDAGDQILVPVRFGGKASGLDLAQIHLQAAHLFEVRKGRVCKLVVYWDRERAFADLGLQE